jgi:hypothetical protein
MNTNQPTNQPTKELRDLADSHIHHIDKKAFLATFGPVFDKAFSKDNILSSFRATGLVPHNPEVVLSKIDVVRGSEAVIYD